MAPDGRLRRALVTGANGFVAQHVMAALAGGGIDVVAVGHDGEPAPGELTVEYVACDLTDLARVEKLPLDEVDTVVNLAGLAAVGESFSQRERYLAVNVGVLHTICTVAAQRRLDGLRILAVSSGAVYGGGQPMPLTESAGVDPSSSPYAESKLAMEICAARHRADGVDCVVVRPFNHIGPGQAPGFLVPDLYAQVQRASRDGHPLRVGNLTTRRDYTDVRDVAAAYVALGAASSLVHPVYNICSGRSRSGHEILDIMLAATGASHLEVVVDPAKFRPSEQPDIVGDNRRLQGEVTWQPAISVEESIGDFVAVG